MDFMEALSKALRNTGNKKPMPGPGEIWGVHKARGPWDYGMDENGSVGIGGPYIGEFGPMIDSRTGKPIPGRV